MANPTVLNLRAIRLWALEDCARYWPAGDSPIRALPIPDLADEGVESLPPTLRFVSLPRWAADLDPDNGIPVPARLVGQEGDWSSVDWLSTISWFMHCLAERAHEGKYGPVHSYSYRLDEWDSRLWDRAWVNRIALFLRRWAEQKDQNCCGSMPTADIRLTHDLDALNISIVIRGKQCAFQLYNALCNALSMNFIQAGRRMLNAARFAFTPDAVDGLTETAALERSLGLRSRIHVYGGPGGWLRSPRNILLDPSYHLTPGCTLARRLCALKEEGWQIGIHPSFGAWNNPAKLAEETSNISSAMGTSVVYSRNHWLRFSFDASWQNLCKVGIDEDATLGFNDRPGFRCGAAMVFRPVASDKAIRLPIRAIPLILMDSQFYDYSDMNESARSASLIRWLNEVTEVHGQASVLWHSHTLGQVYGWREGFNQLAHFIASAHHASKS